MKSSVFSKLLLVSFLFSFAFVSYAQKGDPNLDSRDSHFLTISLSGGATGYTMMPSYSGVLSEYPDKYNITVYISSSAEYAKQPYLSNFISSANSLRLSKFSSVSPGKPTINVVLITISGILALSLFIRFVKLSLSPRRFILFSTSPSQC